MTSPILKQSIKRASILIAFFTVASQLLGLVREAIIANYFGTSAEYDILLVALALPLMVGGILFIAIPSAGIPYLQKNNDSQANILGSSFFKLNSLVILGLTIITYLVLPLFKGLLTEGMTTESADRVIYIARIFCLVIPLRSYESIFRALLHLRHSFLFPVLTPIFFNLAVITGLLTLYPSLASFAFVVAFLGGMIVQTILVALPALLLYRYSAGENEAGNNFNSAGYLKFLGVIGLIESIGLLLDPFDRYVGGIFLDPGYVSAAYYATIVYIIPVRIVIYSLATSIFPTLSERAAEIDSRKVASLYHRALALAVLLIIPTAVYFYLFRNELIWLLFERGKFVLESRLMTVDFLSWLLPGLFFHAAFLLQVKVFYALKSWRYFVIVRVCSMALKFAIGLIFININWALALAGGSSALYLLAFVALELHLVYKKKMSYSTSDKTTIARAFYAAVSAVILFVGLYYLLTNITELHDLVIALITALAGYGLIFLFDQKYGITGLSLKAIFSRK